MTPLDLANSEIAELRQKIMQLEYERDEALRSVEAKIDLEFNAFVDKEYGMTNCETRILLALYFAEGMIHGKEALNNVLVGYDIDRDKIDLKIVDVFVCKVRKKIREKLNIDCIETVWGRGYRIVPEMARQLDDVWERYHESIAKRLLKRMPADIAAE